MSLLNKSKWPLAAAALVGGLLSSSTRAAGNEGADRGADLQDGSRWGLGVAAGFRKSLYKGVGDNNTYLPLISYENNWVRLFGNTLDAKLPSLGPVDFSIRTRVALGEGYRASKSAFLSGMDSRDGSIYLGGAATWNAGFAKVSLDYLHDVSGNSKGSQLKFAVERSFIVAGAWQLTPHASVTELDSKYVDYYYGVKASEATADRPQYTGKSTTQAEAGLRLGYLIAPRQRAFLDLGDTHYGSGVTKSPLVERTSVPTFLLGYSYAF